MMDKYFEYRKHKTNFKTEVIAGVTTFLTMAYIMFLNPFILSGEFAGTEKEKQKLSKWLNKPEEDLKSFYGQPDKVEFLKTRNRNYVYITEKYKIKCERKFEVNPRNIVVGFSSKNCF